MMHTRIQPSRFTLLLWTLALGLVLIAGLLAVVTPRLVVEARVASPSEENRNLERESAADQAVEPGFTVDLARNRIWGMIDPGDVVTVTRTTGGEGFASAEADGVGFFWTHFWHANGQPADIVGGDVLEIYVNGNLAVTISPLTISGEVDVLADQVTGNVNGLTSGTMVTVTMSGIDLAEIGEPQASDDVDGSGDFTADFSGIADVNPGMLGIVQYKDSNGNTIQDYVYPSEVFQVIDWSLVEGFAPLGSTVTATVYMTYPTNVRWQDTGTASWPFGRYQIGGDVEYGDVVEVDLGAGTVIDIETAYFDMDPDAAADQITGNAPAGATIRGAVWNIFDGYNEDTDVADGSGEYTLDLGIDLQTRHYPSVAYSDADGDEVSMSAAPSHIRAYPGDPWNNCSAFADSPNQPVTYTLKTDQGTFSDYQWCSKTNFCDNANFGTEIVAGDVITVELAEKIMSMTVADWSLNLDRDNDQIYGEADIPGLVEAYVMQWYSDLYPIHGSAGGLGTANSSYTISFEDFDVRDGMDIVWGAHYSDDGGNRTIGVKWNQEIAYFEVNAPNGVNGVTPNANELVTATLYTEGGVEIASNNQDDDDDPMRFWLGFDGHPIEVGNWVTVTSESGWTAGLQVPDLTISVDVENDMVTGRGPKSMVMVEHSWNDGQEWNNRFVPVDDYALDLSYFGDDMQWGDSINVIFQALNGNRVREEYLWPQMMVNYGADYLQVNYNAGHTFDITATNGIIEYTASRNTESGQGWWTESGFRTEWDDWTPERPDMEPGFWVEFKADDGYSNVVQVGTITGTLDLEDNSISGSIYAPWFDGELDIWCHTDTQWPMMYRSSSAAADGSTEYYCQWDPEFWDIQEGEDVYVTYVEPDDGDWVTNAFREPGLTIQVNYGHDWIQAKTEPFSTVVFTVAGKGTLEATTDSEGEVYSHDWENDWSLGRPELEPGDVVTATAVGRTAAVNPIGTINGEVDIVENTVSGTIEAPWFSPLTLTVRCEVWVEDGPNGIEVEGVEADGGEYACDFDDVGWDLEYQHDVAVRMFEPDGDNVINVFEQPMPDMRVEKWGEGSGEALAGGPVIYTIRYRNQGNADAETVVLTDTLPANTTYYTDTSGFPASVNGGQVSWMFGPVEPGVEKQFLLVLNNTANPGDTLLNQMDIYTYYDDNEWNNHAEGEVNVVGEGESNLYVNKHPATGNPVPGQTMLWEIYYGNDGPVSSGPVVLTDTLPTGTSIDSWRSENGYDLWVDHSTDDTFILKADTLPGNWGDTIYLRLLVDPAVETNTQLTNMVEIATEGSYAWDMRNDVWTGEPNYDVNIYKQFGWGQLVPGGEVGYNVNINNSGNMPASAVVVDILPEGTTFAESSLWTGSQDIPFPPTGWDNGNPVWDLGDLEPGERYNLNVRVDISTALESGDTIENCVLLTTDAEEDWPNDNESCVEDELKKLGPNLRVYKEYRWDNDNRLEYDIRMENIGTQRLEGVLITDTYPSGTTFNGEWNQQHGPDVSLLSHDPVNRVLVFQINDQFEAGNTGAIRFYVDVDSSGVQGLAYTNMVEAPVTNDVNPEDNSYSVTATSGPDIYVEKWISGGKLEPGEIVTFTIEFGNLNMWPWNTGPESHITDTLPAAMTFITATAPWRPDQPWAPDILPGNKLVWNRGNVWPEAYWQFNVVVQISDTVKAGDVLTNTVEMYSDSVDDIEYDTSNNVFHLSMTMEGEKKIYLPLVLRH
ncbi:MAG: DUF11 domain-containing protein [Anaerolineales bacterium]|nr:DUF11 domain-containing protein [Anaerolineales bacterium]